jgi:hypothetical protein
MVLELWQPNFGKNYVGDVPVQNYYKEVSLSSKIIHRTEHSQNAHANSEGSTLFFL